MKLMHENTFYNPIDIDISTNISHSLRYFSLKIDKVSYVIFRSYIMKIRQRTTLHSNNISIYYLVIVLVVNNVWPIYDTTIPIGIKVNSHN